MGVVLSRGNVTLKPVLSGKSLYGDKKKYYEQVIIFDDRRYPIAMVHIDIFQPGELYDTLYKDGSEVSVTMTFETIE
jgi:hypothetical protein